MSAELSRRGLFRAFRTKITPDAASTDAATEQMVARVSDACVEPRGVTCRRCAEECSLSALRFQPLVQGKAKVLIDPLACSGCGACVGVCPVGALSLVRAERAALIAGLVELGSQA